MVKIADLNDYRKIVQYTAQRSHYPHPDYSEDRP